MPLGIPLAGIAPVALYAGGIGAFCASAMKRPHIGLFYLVPLLPLQTTRLKLQVYPLGAQWIDLMLLGVMIGIWRCGYPIFASTRLTKVFLLFAGFTYVSVWRGFLYLQSGPPLWFSDPRVSDWKNYMVILLLFFLTLAAVRDKKQMKILLLLMCLSMLAMDRDFINTMRGRDFSTFSYDTRDAGAIGYAGVNGLAALEAQFAVFLLGMYSCAKRWKPRLGYLFTVSISLIALMYTLSRGAYFSLIVGVLFIGLLKNRKLLVILVLFLATWQTIVPNAVRERVFMTKTEDGDLDPSAGDRVKLWENALEIFKGDPIFGTGFDTYKFMHALGSYRDTHNFYVKVLLETGVVGLLFFLFLIAKMLAEGWRLRGLESADDGFGQGLGLGFTAWMIAAIIGNFFGDRWMYIEITGYTFVLLGMAVRCQLLAVEEDEAAAAAPLTPETGTLQWDGRQVEYV